MILTTNESACARSSLRSCFGGVGGYGVTGDENDEARMSNDERRSPTKYTKGLIVLSAKFSRNSTWHTIAKVVALASLPMSDWLEANATTMAP